jgi:hypothetical protein
MGLAIAGGMEAAALVAAAVLAGTYVAVRLLRPRPAPAMVRQ